MKTGRLEAFSDGVIAVIITIMVLELKAPHTGTLEALLAVAPSLSIYGLSFAVVAIMWVNHHHLFEKAKGADASLLWSNNLLLFWMSLIPFVTAYLGENCHAPLALCAYGGIMALASTGFLLLQTVLDRQAPQDSARRAEFRRMKRKAFFSVLCYGAAACLAFFSIDASYAVFVIIPLLYFWPEHNNEPADHVQSVTD